MLPPLVQRLEPRPVLPADFERRPFHDSVVSTTSADKRVFEGDAPFVVVDGEFLQLIGDKPSILVLAKQNRAFAHEAGVYIPSNDSVWFTSNLYDVDTNCHVEISSVSLQTGEVTPIDLPIANANGACPYRGRILFCDQGAGPSKPSQLVVVDPVDLSVQPLVNNYHGRAFNSLNDAIVLPGPRETVWFTDPPYGFEQGFRPKCQLPPQVYVFDPANGEVRAVADGFAHPNGICFSPDGKVCYVTDTSHIHGTGRLDAALPSTIYAFDVVWSGNVPNLHNRRLFAFADCGVPDGIKCDTLGNVYSGCGDGIHVWNAAGRLIGKIILGLADDNVGAGCANFCFAPGGRLVCFSEDRIYLVSNLCVEGDLVK